MFGPPGTHRLGGNTGLSLFTNAALPFLDASNFPGASSYYFLPNTTLDPAVGTEPPLPAWPQAYAFNTLVLNRSRTAMLDAPNPEWLSAVRQSMSIGDSWNITANVLGTVASYGGPANDTDTFDDFCARAEEADTLRKQWLDVNASLMIAESPDGDTVVFFGYLEDPNNETPKTCQNFKPVAMRYDLSRRPC